MFDRPQIGERALLVYVFAPGAELATERDELRDLSESAGAQVAAVISASRVAPDARFFIGAGKLAEVRDLVAERGVELVIFNAALSPAQERNLERALQCRVLDRIGLILDLFAQRAKTFEGKLQVELAQLRHISTRLVRGWTHLERQKGGIGLRGPGETQLETDRRLIADRIRRIVQRLDKVGQRRELSRRARRRARTPVVSLVGYTNAGKSTLFNKLTGAGVLVEDRLFATLDPTLRKFTGPTGAEFLLADTVGFVGNLPHALVAAFKSTLEETVQASLLLHIVDVSAVDWELKIEQVDEVLVEIGAGEVPQLLVLNKVDSLDDPIPAWQVDRPWVGVSALQGTGLVELTSEVETVLTRDDLRLSLCIPFSQGRLRSALFEHTRVLAENVDAELGWNLDVEGPASVIERLRRAHGLDEYVLASDATSHGRSEYSHASR